MRNVFLVKTLLAFIVLGVLSVPTFADGYVVIVNDKNNFSGSKKELVEQVKQLFLKRKGNWPDGTKARPLGVPNGSSEYQSFLQHVLDMSDSQLAQHWLRIKQINGKTQPDEINNARVLAKIVARHKGAFAVVASETTLPEGVKVLFPF